MSRRAILDHYTWASGSCFRHPREGALVTAALKTLHPAGGDPVEVRACEDCVLELEAAREELAARLGKKYEPGRLGLP
ncbi:hypothetical protein ACFW6R_04680 [Streptomyces albidoflavus]